MRRAPCMILACAAAALSAQTQIDLKTQSKSVDFSAAPSTKPLQTGAVLPATCTVGQMFFNTSASSGQNLFGCVAMNAWLPETGTAALTIQNQGVLVGARPIVDFATGLGVLQAISDTGVSILVQSSLDTATAQTKGGQQSGQALLCASASGSASAYTCSLSPALTIYTPGMLLHWKPDVSGTGAPATLNVDALGAIPITLADGVTAPGPSDMVAGRTQEIWYDGANFRLLNLNPSSGVLGEARPVCGAAVRGRTWFVAGGTGVQDSFTVCAKDITGTYAWRTIY
ncbi:MAG: hypothetical protein JO307_32865 [Bryobacterales bacterium]|nr:hypothetical protein [Bryobacterales bacterium]MBV9399227.1 hypothetical protein [Bryobacterales bacterium]